MSALRHSWGEPVRFVHKTERSCVRDGCDIVKVTRHDGDMPWIEFWRDGERLEVDKTPACEGERAAPVRAADEVWA